MIAAIIIIGLALYWLGHETDWLRIRLAIGETINEYDQRVLAEIGAQEAEYNARYQQWISDRHAVKYVPSYMIATEPLDVRDKWMALEDNLAARRSGEMVYQRRKGV